MYELFPRTRNQLLHYLHLFAPSLGEEKLGDLEKTMPGFWEIEVPSYPTHFTVSNKSILSLGKGRI